MTPMWFDYDGRHGLGQRGHAPQEGRLDSQESAALASCSSIPPTRTTGSASSARSTREILEDDPDEGRASPRNSTRSGRSTRSTARRTDSATRRSTSDGFCSSARWTSRHVRRLTVRQAVTASARMVTSGRVAIAGGSLGGLTTGLVLRDPGLDVTVFERSPAELQERGAGIGLLPDTYRYLVERAGVPLDEISTRTTHIRYLVRDGDVVHDDAHVYRFSSWNTVYRRLLGCFGRDRYRLGAEVTGSSTHGDASRSSSPTAIQRLLRSARLCRRRRITLPPRLLPDVAAVLRRLRGVAGHGARSRARRRTSRRARRRDHVLRVRQQPHPRVPDTRAGRFGRARASA